MKFIKKFLLLVIMGISTPQIIYTMEELPEFADDKTDASRAKKLNMLLEQQFTQLDEINSILQYLAQAINKGAIKVKDKKVVQNWLEDQQRIIRSIEKSTIFPPEESRLHQLTNNIQLLINHIIQTINNKFKNLEDFKLVEEPVKRNKTDIATIEENIDDNISLIETLRQTANSSGLSTINIIARRIDSINNQYKITKTIEYLPATILAGATALYFTPAKYFTDIPFLGRAKTWLGTSNFTDPDPKKATKSVKNNHGDGYYNRMVNLIASKETKALFPTLTVVMSLLMSKNSWHPETAALREKCRQYWDKLKGFSINDNHTYNVIKDITLDDEQLVGLDGQVEELRNLVRYITDPEIYDRTNSNLDKGVLLTGPTRCGKTFAAKALCGTLNKALSEKGSNTEFKFREIKWGEVKWSSEGIKTLIEQAKKNAPCILFIDEIHNLPLQTKEGGEILTEFLVGMSGVNSENDARHQVILLAATNQPEMLDAALLQPGRFGTIVRFEKPSYANRIKYFKTVFKLNAINTDKIEIESLARQTENCSYGDLEFIVKNARFTARTLAKSVTQEHLQDQINKYVYKIKSDFPLTNQEKHVLAIHQAGHALMYMLLDTQEKLEVVTIRGRWTKIQEGRYWDQKQKNLYKPRTTIYGGLFTYNNSEMLKIQSHIEKEKLCKIKLAGLLAEKIILGSSGHMINPKDKHAVHMHDKKQALSYTKAIVFDGLDKDDLPKSEYEKLNLQAYELLKKYEQEAFDILNKNKHLLAKISTELEQKTILSAKEIRAIID